MNDLLQKVANTVTNEPVKVTVDIMPAQWWKFRPRKKTFFITQITLGNLVRISKLLLKLDGKIYDQNNLLESNYQAMEKYGDTVAEIVAIAFHNKKDMPPDSLVEMVKENFTSKDLLNVMSVTIKQMDVISFMSTIISVKGLGILESQTAGVKIANGAAVSL